jgi:hypothetical protein
MVRCSLYCSYPELSVDASHHHCPSCGNKFHGLCSDAVHPQAAELGLGLGNDTLCPNCARLFHPRREVNSPISSSDEDSSNAGIGDDSSSSVVKAPVVGVAQGGSAFGNASTKSKKQYKIYQLPPNVTVNNTRQYSGVKCHFASQSLCKYKDHPDLVIGSSDKCEKIVHVQCFLHLILGENGKQVSFNFFPLSFLFIPIFPNISSFFIVSTHQR